ncbi:hypothetical protein DL897_04475 [Thermoflavimicrobium daqui]|uniref:Uncharacterized protein n=1 Tax=Thermoflavimicrobium daqui TaxID=2137476 RepID=A0A364K7J3_9BACL|nr:hypothetical protein DL897_04475 [Thermoflavimicrobium daqui]
MYHLETGEKRPIFDLCKWIYDSRSFSGHSKQMINDNMDDTWSKFWSVIHDSTPFVLWLRANYSYVGSAFGMK